jgi:hypothetical protein
MKVLVCVCVVPFDLADRRNADEVQLLYYWKLFTSHLENGTTGRVQLLLYQHCEQTRASACPLIEPAISPHAILYIKEDINDENHYFIQFRYLNHEHDYFSSFCL